MTELDIVLRVIESILFFFFAIYIGKGGIGVVRDGFSEMRCANIALRRIRKWNAANESGKVLLYGIRLGEPDEKYVAFMKEWMASLKKRRNQGILRMIVPAILVLFFLGLAWLFFPY